MNQKIWLSGILTLALISTGCTSQANTENKGSAESQGTVNTQSGTTTTKTDASSTTKEGNRSTIGKYGKVKKIVGNSVTIELAELPKRPDNSQENASTAKGTSSEEGPPAGAPPAGEPPAGGGAPPSGSGGNGGPSSGGGTGGGATGSSSGMKGSFGLNTEELDLTGEVVELMIPVGVKITSKGTGAMKEIDFADIAQGDTIALYYVEGTENIERVVITPSTSN